MMTEIIDTVSGVAAEALIAAAIALLTWLGKKVSDLAASVIGEHQVDALRARLDAAIERAVESGIAEGVDRDLLEMHVADYVKHLMRDSLDRLGVTDYALARRVKADVAILTGGPEHGDK